MTTIIFRRLRGPGIPSFVRPWLYVAAHLETLQKMGPRGRRGEGGRAPGRGLRRPVAREGAPMEQRDPPPGGGFALPWDSHRVGASSRVESWEEKGEGAHGGPGASPGAQT